MEKIFKIEFDLGNDMDWRPCVEEYQEALVTSAEKCLQYNGLVYLSKKQLFTFLRNEDFFEDYLKNLRNLLSEWNHLAINEQRLEGLIEDEDVEYFETMFFDRTYIRCVVEDYEVEFKTICEVFDLELVESDLAMLRVRDYEIVHPSVKKLRKRSYL